MSLKAEKREQKREKAKRRMPSLSDQSRRHAPVLKKKKVNVKKR